MAKKKYIPKKKEDDGLRPEERVAQKFAEQLIEKLEGAKLDWEKPWFSNMNMGAPRNFDNRRYKGMNQLFLALKQEEMGYQLPVWITYLRAKQLGAEVNKGEKSMTVWLGSRYIKDKDGNSVSPKEFNEMSEEERNQCSIKPFAKAFSVFNIQQTNYPELFPEKYNELKENMMVKTEFDEQDMLKVTELDYMLDNKTWVCPIEQKQSDDAYYSISKDQIVVPLKKQFVNGESFYKTLLHEMAHSTGADNRLERIKPSTFGSTEYAREELVAEMTAAIVANSMGFSSGIKDDSVAYFQSWLDELKESPKFMLTVMRDVNKACDMIESQVYSKKLKEDIEEETELLESQADDKSLDTAPEKVHMGIPENTAKGSYNVENDNAGQVYGTERKEPVLHKAYLGNGITVWEDGDVDYTGHINPDRTVTMHKEFTPANKERIQRLAEYGNLTYNIDDKTKALILDPVNMVTHLLPNNVTGEMYPVSREMLNPEKPQNQVYCTGKYLLDDTVADKLVEIRYPREYVFSITGMDNIRPVFYKLAKQGVDVSEMDSMLEITDAIIEKKTLSNDEIENKVLYFHVKDNKIDKFNRLVEEVGAELPRYWFHENRLQYNHPGREASKNQSDAQILAGGQSIVRVKDVDKFLPSIEALKDKGVAILPKLEAEMQVMTSVAKDKTGDERKEATMYFFVKDGVVVDTEPKINERDYDLPKFVYDGAGFTRWQGQQQAVDNKQQITHQLNNKNMENKLDDNRQKDKLDDNRQKELKDGFYLFLMKSGDYGLNEVKNGERTPTIRFEKNSPELTEFFASVKGKNKAERDEELKKFAAKHLTPENLAAAKERSAQREQQKGEENKKESQYINLPKANPEVRERIDNVRIFKMQDGKTMAVSADIDGAHMTKPMGDKLQNTFFAKAKGTTGDEKKELDVAVAAMTFRKELSEPKQEQNQSAGMKR